MAPGCATGGRGWSTTGAGTETGSGAGAGGAAPVPVSAIVCDPTLLATVTVAERVPAAEGVNVYDRLHACAGASVAPHADVSSAKSPALSPPSVMPWSVSVPAPLLATVTVLVVVVPPSSRLPASAVDGTLSQATGAAPGASLPWTVNLSVNIAVRTGVPLKPVISSILKKFVLNGLPTTSCMTVESPMKPAGGIDTRVSHCRKFGPIRLPASEA